MFDSSKFERKCKEKKIYIKKKSKIKKTKENNN